MYCEGIRVYIKGFGRLYELKSEKEVIMRESKRGITKGVKGVEGKGLYSRKGLMLLEEGKRL